MILHLLLITARTEEVAWSQWSDWSECMLFGTGELVRTRRRVCLSLDGLKLSRSEPCQAISKHDTNDTEFQPCETTTTALPSTPPVVNITTAATPESSTNGQPSTTFKTYKTSPSTTTTTTAELPSTSTTTTSKPTPEYSTPLSLTSTSKIYNMLFIFKQKMHFSLIEKNSSYMSQ